MMSDRVMFAWTRTAAMFVALSVAFPAVAQTTLIEGPTPQPVITITSSASDEVANDRMTAVLRAEADGADATQAASVVNRRMAQALSRAKAVSGVDARTAGYSSD
jgi:predicted secreted protein